MKVLTDDATEFLLDKSDSQVDSENVDSVVLSLGTNDVTQYRNDTEQIIVNVTTCVENVKHQRQALYNLMLQG
jgi:lysophospholipase L1-like esterase